MIVDLHCHSTASDGLLAPAEVVARAAGQGVALLALTDHDTTTGLPEAAEAARRLGMGFVPGIEISTTWSHGTVHIVGLDIDPDHPRLRQGLEQLAEERARRAEVMIQRLARLGIVGAEAAIPGDPRAAGRSHFARWLVDQGHAKDWRQAFKRYLGRGKPAYVPGRWATLAEAVEWIRSAGGVAVLAHPARYRLTHSKLTRLLTDFRTVGGTALEVVSSSHSEDDRRCMAQLAGRFALWASAGSDFHGPGGFVELGRDLTLPRGCRPLWSRWRDRLSNPENTCQVSPS